MIENTRFAMGFPLSETCLWHYRLKKTASDGDGSRSDVVHVAPPIFEVDGEELLAVLVSLEPVCEPRRLPHGVTEYVLRGSFVARPSLALEMVFRLAPESPVVRFCYRLLSDGPAVLTKAAGSDRLRYLGLSLAGAVRCTEVRFSEFEALIHSYHLTEHAVPDRAFDASLSLMGPMLVAEGEGQTLLVAYEHGSQAPDAFLAYHLSDHRAVELQAIKGNYAAGRRLDGGAGYETVWLELAAAQGDRMAMAAHYRDFVLHAMSPNVESRRPYIFYNTWNYQERHKWWDGATFLDAMHQQRMLEEIDVAHAMGIDVFVIDTGWYEKTGDWRVNRERFPDGLKAVKARLDRYGMKLGLWFSPREAAVSSTMLQSHRDCLMAWDGEVRPPHPVWETEESQDLCLVSRYWEAFADALIRLNREVGVTYFKWDAIHQYGCNAPGHDHGTEANSPEERADCYAFELPRMMARVVDRVCAACPEAIVDFDITEGQRAVGLGFLAAGKFFLINNGPYYRSLDDPDYAPGGGMGANVFVFPGPARARVCRTPLDYDTWVPSVLFLTHYLPDDPASSQAINLASLVLGQNGIWGDLLAVTSEGVARWSHGLARYKQVRDDITESFPVRTGVVGGSPEIHEKINAATGRGVIAVFAAAPGTYGYVTAATVDAAYWASEGVEVSFDTQGRARLEMVFAAAGAKVVFFGVD